MASFQATTDGSRGAGRKGLKMSRTSRAWASWAAFSAAFQALSYGLSPGASRTPLP
jgi:hypothetical protein